MPVLALVLALVFVLVFVLAPVLVLVLFAADSPLPPAGPPRPLRRLAAPPVVHSQSSQHSANGNIGEASGLIAGPTRVSAAAASAKSPASQNIVREM